MAPDVHRLIGQDKNAAEKKPATMRLHEERREANKCLFPPSETQLGWQVGPVAVGDVGVFLEEEGDLLVGVQPDPVGQQHWPVVVAAQFHVMGSLQQLLRHLQQHGVLRYKAGWLEKPRLGNREGEPRFCSENTFEAKLQVKTFTLIPSSHILSLPESHHHDIDILSKLIMSYLLT